MTGDHTLGALIARSAQRLLDAHAAGQLSFGQGTTNAHDEASWLVLWQLGLSLDTDVAEYDAQLSAYPATSTDAKPLQTQALPFSPEQIASVDQLIEKRITTRKPAAYLTQEAWLQGVSFYIDERAIVPRSLIAEVLADVSIDPWLHPDTTQVLDLCTGNGSLGILMALAFPDVTVLGLDISSDALEVARINIDRHDLQQRMQVMLSDGLQQAVQHAPSKGVFDLIVCNPPYVNARSMSELPQEFKAEPELALAGGTDGMDFVRQLLKDAPAHMSEHAVLVLEIGHERTFFEAAFPTLDVVWLSTSAGDDQVLLITREALMDWNE
jgi:ribosomal protein L3 glutamine methyltransferase